ncbi:MAG: hypothetical protein R6X33_14750 [Candidatus Brocadiia bacterium]
MSDSSTDEKPDSKGLPEDHGLVCRGCGCRHFHVIYTRRTSKNRILRRRECRHCGRRITTYEEAI